MAVRVRTSVGFGIVLDKMVEYGIFWLSDLRTFDKFEIVQNGGIFEL